MVETLWWFLRTGTCNSHFHCFTRIHILLRLCMWLSQRLPNSFTKICIFFFLTSGGPASWSKPGEGCSAQHLVRMWEVMCLVMSVQNLQCIYTSLCLSSNSYIGIANVNKQQNAILTVQILLVMKHDR